MLTFPRVLTPDSLTDIQVPEYPVNTFTSDQGVEWRSLDSCVAVNASMTLNFASRVSGSSQSCWPLSAEERAGVDVVCVAWQLWEDAFSTLLAFEIAGDHPLWDLMESKALCYQAKLASRYWRFKSKPVANIQTKSIWDLRIELVGSLIA